MHIVSYKKSVSVVIPTKNGFGVIINALNSLITSCYYINDVYIVLSNCSDDYACFLTKVIDNYNEFFIITIIDAGKGNASAARNLGVFVSKSPFIALLDDDDIWLPNRLKLIFSNQKFNPNAVNFTNPILIEHKSSAFPQYDFNEKKFTSVSKYLFVENGIIQTSDLLLPRKIAQLNPFDETLPRHQDYDFCLKLERNNIVFNLISIRTIFWYQYPVSVISKGANTDFCLRWIIENSSQLSDECIDGYLKKDAWYVAYKERRLFYFLYKVFKFFGLKQFFSIIFFLIKKYR